jgi:hypothetical protein
MPPIARSRHVDLTGRILEYPVPEPRVVQFIARLAEAAADPHLTPAEVRGLAFGPDNPILARHPTLPGAYPDATTVRDPIYWVCVDLIMRAEARAAGVSTDTASAPFTMTVMEAARKLGRYQHAIQNAIKNRTLHAWVRAGRLYLLPKEVEAYSVPRRGRTPRKKPEL